MAPGFVVAVFDRSKVKSNQPFVFSSSFKRWADLAPGFWVAFGFSNMVVAGFCIGVVARFFTRVLAAFLAASGGSRGGSVVNGVSSSPPSLKLPTQPSLKSLLVSWCSSFKPIVSFWAAGFFLTDLFLHIPFGGLWPWYLFGRRPLENHWVCH